jgi:Galactose oxidase, central domain
VTLKTIANTTITATDVAAASITGSSTPISVFSNAPTHLLIATVGNATTRTPISVEVKALDAANNVSIGYAGTVHFTSTDAKAILPADATLPNGFGNFSATFETTGNQMIAVTDTVKSSLTQTSSSISVSAAAALAITSGTPPSGTFGVGYGPITTEYLRCTLRCASISCTPCTGSSGCMALPPCGSRNRVFPCVETRQLLLGFPLTAAGGVPPYKWHATGLPPGLGLSVNSGNGYISGKPTSPASYTVVVTVGDSGTPQVTTPPNSYTIVINDPPVPVINATPAPSAGAVNLPYSFTFTASSTAPPLIWRESSGTLPPGLSLSQNGVLSGTPTATGSFPITLVAQDSFKQDSAAQNFTIQIFAHGFKAAGSMSRARASHTATLLSNGKVLVAGGTDANGSPVAAAELYDPTTGSFSPTGSMATARSHFAATLLSSGKVLVTGGLDTTGNAIGTAETYDPSAGTFSATTGSMQFVHASHTATLLNTGKVLVAGWGNAVAELFDPSTGTFAQTGSMAAPRVSHTATLLNNGKVLVTGGIGAAMTVLREAEFYDPITGSFSPTLGSMATARQWHTASLLIDGKVLVTGRLADNSGTATATAEVFDPTTQLFAASKGGMGTARAFQTATVLKDGTVLAAGGDPPATVTLLTAELYDPTSQTFTPTGSMGTARASHTATLLNDGRVLVVGGVSGNGALATAEAYQ